MIKKLLYFLLLGLILSSCSKDEIEIDPNNLLLGVWEYNSYHEDALIYSRSAAFTENQCYKFMIDGTLIERQNSGFCGTPPITYANYPGTWRIINDTLIRIDVEYWGGMTNYLLDIETINDELLKVIPVYSGR